MPNQNNRAKTIGRATPLGWLSILAGLLVLVFASINMIWLYGDVSQKILWAVGLYLVASAIWLAALRIGLRNDSGNRRLVPLIIVFAVSFRVIQICAPPILEIDLYRYIWDGITVNNGVSPYRFAPADILTKEIAVQDPVQTHLITVAEKSPTHHQILSKVHYPDYTTIYPPVSQAVFAATTWLVPDSASANAHLVAMKVVLVLFDLATLGMLFALLSLAEKHRAWAIAYAWNPLVIKEIANSGHLDSIAVFLTTAAVYCLARWISGWLNGSTHLRFEVLSAVLLAMGTAAKLFSLVLAPLFVVVLFRKHWSAAVRFAVLYMLMAATLMSAMLIENDQLQQRLGYTNSPPVPAEKSKEGLTGFLSHWRMNDVIFSFVFENTKAPEQLAEPSPWYVFVNAQTRQRIDRFVRDQNLSTHPPFFCARTVTVCLFGLIYIMWLARVLRVERMALQVELLPQVFLVIAAFFMLQPTQNPWYWLWAMPFVCFARNRGWLTLSCLLLLYYLRFWFKHSDLAISFLEYQYTGAGIFDHWVAWLEHALIWGCLLVSALTHRWRKRRELSDGN